MKNFTVVLYVFILFRIQKVIGLDKNLKTGTRSGIETDVTLYPEIAPEIECEDFVGKSCNGSCGEFFSLPCSCDEYCQVFNRCCHDYHNVCPVEALEAREKHSQLMTTTFECASVSVPHVPEMVINSCPLDSSHELQHQCEYEPKSNILPLVMSRNSRLHFKNIYCLICNDENETDVEYWKILLGTNRRRDVNLGSLEKLPNLFSNPKTYIPPPDSPVWTCSNEIISTCSKDASLKESDLCETSTSSLVQRTIDRSIYKNIFCLLCNINNSSLLAHEVCQELQADDLIQPPRYPLYSYVLNWNRGIATVVAKTKRSVIQEFQCSTNTTDFVDCKVTKCDGTIPIVNGECSKNVPYFGCVYFPFTLRFRHGRDISNDSLWSTVYSIATNIDSVLLEYETDQDVKTLNHSKYMALDVNHGYVTVNICISVLMYNPCSSNFFGVQTQDYQKYIENNTYRFGFNGELFYCRFSSVCHKWCVDEFQLCGSEIFNLNVTNENASNTLTLSTLTAILIFVMILFVN